MESTDISDLVENRKEGGVGSRHYRELGVLGLQDLGPTTDCVDRFQPSLGPGAYATVVCLH